MNESAKILRKEMKVNDVLKERNISKAQAARLANIPQNDFYQATNGKRSFFPAWRRRLSEALNMPENELFPEYQKKDKSTGKMTNYEFMKNMSIEEMAVTIMCPNDMGMAEISCDKSNKCDCCKCCLEWLKEDVKDEA
jgi:hypothetical protein